MNEDKFIVLDATDIICIGGFGNDKGNIGLLKYSENEIVDMVMENNNNDDNIRLIISLLRTIRNQKDRTEKAIEYIDKEVRFVNMQEYHNLSKILKGEENNNLQN